MYKLEITKQMANAANVMIIPKTTVSPLSPKNENYLQNTTFQNEMSKKKYIRLIEVHNKTCLYECTLSVHQCYR